LCLSVISCGDAYVVLEIVEEPFEQVSLSIGPFAEREAGFPVTLWRNSCHLQDALARKLLARPMTIRRQRHQRIQVTHQPLTNRLAMTANDILPASETLLFQPGVQVVETVEPGRRNEKIPASIANHAFDHCHLDGAGRQPTPAQSLPLPGRPNLSSNR